MEQEKTAVQVLREARRLIADMGWCRGHFALNAAGLDVNECDPDARAFCSSGAIWRAADADNRKFVAAKSLLLAAIHPSTLVGFNDDPGRTREEVIAAFDRAIALAEKG